MQNFPPPDLTPTIPLSSTVPLIESGTGSAGASDKAARADHVHPILGGGGELIDANNLNDLTDKPLALSTLGIGSAGLLATTAFDAANAAATAQALLALKGNNLSDLPSVVAARRNLGVGYFFIPSDYGFITWAFDPIQTGSSRSIILTPSAAGTLNLIRLHVPVATTITNLHFLVNVAGSGLTSGQNFGALYDKSGNLLRQTVDQTANWATTGLITMALSSAYVVSAPDDFYVGFWCNGSTGPTVMGGLTFIATGGAIPNGALAAPNLRFAIANTSLTTTAPNPFGTQTTSSVTWWVALS